LREYSSLRGALVAADAVPWFVLESSSLLRKNVQKHD
jgi:hypothetical protein